ncbi:uncharacterized protein LOC132943586 [Metopolophium dirhodum]|uniref:uncharacterized protein LOC132943586 n=1 Tax=Metopolophium dirhodum TaxID=44670 RepID=UPI00298FE377|nr:uncharacterized protein LOC132943586 [Metopolophium dirhodum]
MVLKNEPRLMSNIPLLKMIGFYQILNSRNPIVFGCNIFKCIAIIEACILIAAVFAFILNAFYFLSDINEGTKYFTMGVMAVIASCKLCYIIGYSDTIWNCLHITSVEYLSYKYHSRCMIDVGRQKLKSFLIISIVVWTTASAGWTLTPFIIQSSYLRVEVNNEIYHYRTNILNIVYPATDTFYNDHFIMFFVIEFIIPVVFTHSTLMFDILLISTCSTIACHLKTIANSFSTLGNAENHLMIRHDETKTLKKFKFIIQDQQKVIENMKNIYKVIRPVILLQIAATSSIIILLSSMTIMNYFNGLSLVSPLNFKFISTILTYAMHMYFICYLLNDINEQIDSLNFALYSGDWTSKSLKYKKMILLAMRMNSANRLKMQVTMTRIVNLEMFAGVMRTTYSITSVFSDQCAKNKI